MPSIRILEDDVRGKIAAGEVIVRPASVVKELIENSIDAGANRIEVEIQNGGKDKCLVNDDGMGMGREDAQLALERYATSKIASVNDIDSIRTFGFRGEALASIAQVSRFEMETSDGQLGTRVVAQGGVVSGVFNSERPRGTRIRVSDVFYNLPARRKFLKSVQWERRLIVELVKNYSLVHPKISFSLNDGARTILSLASVDSMHGRARALLTKRIADLLVSIDCPIGNMRIVGFLSRPDLPVRHKLTALYVNSRPVKYPRLYHTIMEAYENPKTVPVYALNIVVEPGFVDANIHPAKTEVKFKDERYVSDLVSQMIRREVFQRSVKTGHLSQGHELPATPGPTAHYVQDAMISYGPEKVEPVHGSDEFWQLHDTYILAQTKSGLIIVDQHVAHERVIYETVMKGRVQSQRLLFPITIELTPEEHEVYRKTKRALEEMGIEFKEFSAQTVVVDSVPADFRIYRDEIAGIFSELLELGDLVHEKSKIARVVACHGAIKAGQRLSPPEMRDLIDRLFATDNPYTCPHGRPIVIRWTIEDLEHKFGRA
ncbi:MAG: DNA mismatch repair endonuclease MutL [candidate division WOR-3 bacterium]|jgi:DNA mismatch repair protein MutL